MTKACAAGVVTKTTDRDSERYTYNGTRRVRQLALGCESNWVKSTHDAYENTWKCGELKLYFSPSAGGWQKLWRTLCKKTKNKKLQEEHLIRAEEGYLLVLHGPNNAKSMTGVFARTNQHEEENEETGIKPAWTEIMRGNIKKYMIILKIMEDQDTSWWVSLLSRSPSAYITWRNQQSTIYNSLTLEE